MRVVVMYVHSVPHDIQRLRILAGVYMPQDLRSKRRHIEHEAGQSIKLTLGESSVSHSAPDDLSVPVDRDRQATFDQLGGHGSARLLKVAGTHMGQLANPEAAVACVVVVEVVAKALPGSKQATTLRADVETGVDSLRPWSGRLTARGEPPCNSLSESRTGIPADHSEVESSDASWTGDHAWGSRRGHLRSTGDVGRTMVGAQQDRRLRDGGHHDLEGSCDHVAPDFPDGQTYHPARLRGGSGAASGRG